MARRDPIFISKLPAMQAGHLPHPIAAVQRAPRVVWICFMNRDCHFAKPGVNMCVRVQEVICNHGNAPDFRSLRSLQTQKHLLKSLPSCIELISATWSSRSGLTGSSGHNGEPLTWFHLINVLGGFTTLWDTGPRVFVFELIAVDRDKVLFLNRRTFCWYVTFCLLNFGNHRN